MAALSLSLQRTATMAAARPQLQAALQFPRLRTLLPELSALVGGWLLRAVPKKKTSHSRKSMRSANKGIARKSNLSHCEGCGQPKMTHHLCLFCYSKSNRFFKFLANPDKARPMLPESSNAFTKWANAETSWHGTGQQAPETFEFKDAIRKTIESNQEEAARPKTKGPDPES